MQKINTYISATERISSIDNYILAIKRISSIDDYIFEKLHINKDVKNPYNYYPKTKEELQRLLWELVGERGIEADLNDIDTSQIKDMAYLFHRSTFNGDISNWDVSNVRDMAAMFIGSNFDGDISNWNVSSVENMEGMFYNSKLLKNKKIPNWYLASH